MHRIFFVILPLFFVACSEKPKTYNGYIDASLVYISSEYGGKLLDINVSKGAKVAQNAYLFTLEQTTEDLNVKIAKDSTQELEAQKQEIENKINYAQINLQRVKNIYKDNGASKDELDNAVLTLENLNENLKAINFKIKQQHHEIAQKEWKAKQKEAFASDGGIIFDTYFSKGEFVASGTPVLSIVTKQNIKATFFIQETELSKISLGQNIKLVFDGTHETLNAKINYISNIAEYTPPIIFSKDEKQKLVFKVEAKPENIDLLKLHIGQPVLVFLQ